MKKQEIKVVYNSNPLPDEYSEKAKKFYIFCGILCLMGILIHALLAIGILAFIIGYAWLQQSLGYKRKDLRKVKFKFVKGVTYDEIFNAIQPVLMKKYGMELERGKDDIVVINYNKMIYDLYINEDNTFTIWWRVSVARAFFTLDRVKKEYGQIEKGEMV